MKKVKQTKTTNRLKKRKKGIKRKEKIKNNNLINNSLKNKRLLKKISTKVARRKLIQISKINNNRSHKNLQRYKETVKRMNKE